MEMKDKVGVIYTHTGRGVWQCARWGYNLGYSRGGWRATGIWGKVFGKKNSDYM